MKWVAMFSQTGSEIVSIAKALGISPDIIMTNNVDGSKYKYHPDLKCLCEIQTGDHNTLMTYLRDRDRSYTLITLHGYLRIIPPDVCARYEMYNGHPGAIDTYPELKGKDPQERVWNNRTKYPYIGSVVHAVTAGVDEGNIVSNIKCVNRVNSLNEMYGFLRETSLQSWLIFLRSKLNENRY